MYGSIVLYFYMLWYKIKEFCSRGVSGLFVVGNVLISGRVIRVFKFLGFREIFYFFFGVGIKGLIEFIVFGNILFCLDMEVLVNILEKI